MRIRAQYEDYFRESLELDYLSRDRTLDQEALHAMIDLMVDVCCSTRKSIRINREDMPIEVVKSRFMKLDAEHIVFLSVFCSSVCFIASLLLYLERLQPPGT